MTSRHHGVHPPPSIWRPSSYFFPFTALCIQPLLASLLPGAGPHKPFVPKFSSQTTQLDKPHLDGAQRAEWRKEWELLEEREGGTWTQQVSALCQVYECQLPSFSNRSWAKFIIPRGTYCFTGKEIRLCLQQSQKVLCGTKSHDLFATLFQ